MTAQALDPRDVFQDALNRAILEGVVPSRWAGLSSSTFAAVDAVAREHPEATAGHIAAAYDAFAREQAADDDAFEGPPSGDAPNRLVARKDRFEAR